MLVPNIIYLEATKMDIFKLPHNYGITPVLDINSTKRIDFCTGITMETSTIEFSLQLTPETDVNAFTRARRAIPLRGKRTLSEVTVNTIESQINSILEEWLEELGSEEYLVSTIQGLANLNLSELTVDSELYHLLNKELNL